MSSEIRIARAETEKEKQAIYRFRYKVFVEELGRHADIANHEQGLLYESYDEYSHNFYATDNDEIVATKRITCLGDRPLSQEMIDFCQLAPILAEVPPSAICILSRAIVPPEDQDTDVFFRLFGEVLRFINQHRIQLLLTLCEPHFLNFYTRLGFRPYSKNNVNSSIGYVIPIALVCEDIPYLQGINSPLLKYIQDFGSDARIPPIMDQIRSEGSSVLSSSSANYLHDVYGEFAEKDSIQLSVFDGFSEFEIQCCLKESNIIECRQGDRVLKKGDTSHNLYVVLSGTFEVRYGDTAIAVMGVGDIIGEMAFFLKQSRARDVYAVTEDARILSLSEANFQRLIKLEPEIAAKLLFNISKMLCFKLLKM